MTKGKGRNKKSGKMVIPKSLATHGLPQIKSTITIPHMFRFVFTATTKVDVTFARLGSVFVVATAATTSALIWTRVKLLGVRMFGVSAPNTINFTYSGITTGISGDDIKHTDSSVGGTYIAAIPNKYGAWQRPSSKLQLSQWQSCLAANTAIAFTVESDQTGVYVDVMLQFECPTDNSRNNNGGPTISGATLGDVLYLGLDSLVAGSSVLKPVGVDNIA